MLNKVVCVPGRVVRHYLKTVVIFLILLVSTLKPRVGIGLNHFTPARNFIDQRYVLRQVVEACPSSRGPWQPSQRDLRRVVDVIARKLRLDRSTNPTFATGAA